MPGPGILIPAAATAARAAMKKYTRRAAKAVAESDTLRRAVRQTAGASRGKMRIEEEQRKAEARKKKKAAAAKPKAKAKAKPKAKAKAKAAPKKKAAAKKKIY